MDNIDSPAPKISYSIIRDRCVACGMCLRACPAGAVNGAPRTSHSIDKNKCINCGKCFDACMFEAVTN